MYKANIGFDMAMWNNRLTLTMDYYDHDSYDLIGRIRTGGIDGEALKLANYADMEAYGVEGP